MILDAKGEVLVPYAGAKVEKSARMATSIEDWPLELSNKPSPRGVTVYNAFELLGASGFKKDGERITVRYQMPIFLLTISERIDIVRMCSPVFGVVTGRMNRVSGMEWCVTKQSKEEDRLAYELRQLKSLFDEWTGETGPKALGIRIRCRSMIMRRLPEVRPDLSNFDSALRRWAKRIKSSSEDLCSEIEHWLRHPNQEDSFEEFTKKAVFDLMTHGAAAPYKEELNDRLENVYMLPGGTVYPVKGQYVGQAMGYIQVVDNHDPQVMFADEMSFLRYSPRSDSSYGLVPLEALVNKVAESLMFDQRAAEMADGTRPPDKLLAFGDRSPMGNLGEEFELPLDKDEQKRIEQVVNEARKEALRVISGHGTPVVVDVSRADTFGEQNERQRMVREEVGLVFGASNAEMNLQGSDSTSGRSTSEAQERADMYKGIYPIVQTLESFWTHDVIPFRFGEGYDFTYKPGQSEQARNEELKGKKEFYTINEIRTKDLGEDPLKGEQYDQIQGAPPPPQPQPPMGGLM